MNLSMFGRREILGGRIYFDKEISNVAQTLICIYTCTGLRLFCQLFGQVFRAVR